MITKLVTGKVVGAATEFYFRGHLLSASTIFSPSEVLDTKTGKHYADIEAAVDAILESEKGEA